MNRIKEARKAAGLSQSDTATRLGITQPTVSGWESGDYAPDMRHISAMCELFSVTPNQLLGFGDEASSPLPSKPEKNKPYITFSDGNTEPLALDEERLVMQFLLKLRRQDGKPSEFETDISALENKSGIA